MKHICIAFTTNKNGKQRAFRDDFHQMRYFPIALDRAKMLIATGQATEVEYRPYSQEGARMLAKIEAQIAFESMPCVGMVQ